jgi:hypothetical protein
MISFGDIMTSVTKSLVIYRCHIEALSAYPENFFAISEAEAALAAYPSAPI